MFMLSILHLFLVSRCYMRNAVAYVMLFFVYVGGRERVSPGKLNIAASASSVSVLPRQQNDRRQNRRGGGGGQQGGGSGSGGTPPMGVIVGGVGDGAPISIARRDKTWERKQP